MPFLIVKCAIGVELHQKPELKFSNEKNQNHEALSFKWKIGIEEAQRFEDLKAVPRGIF